MSISGKSPLPPSDSIAASARLAQRQHRTQPQHQGRGDEARPVRRRQVGQPANQGRTAICPAANTMVKAPMPAPTAPAAGCARTKAVVDATTDRNTAPNSRPEASTSGQASDSAGISVASPAGR